MVSLSQKHPSLQQSMSRSHSSASLTPSTKKSPSNNMAASDPDLARQLFKANVKLAIEDRMHGSSAKFEELRSKFSASETSPIEISQYLTALTHFVTRLEAPMYTPLVRAIVQLNWILYPPAIQSVYVTFLGALATAQTTYLPLMLASLLGEFTDVSPAPNGLRADLHLHAHHAIRHLLDLVPSGNTILIRSIRERFPHESADRREQISYVFNLIRMGDYVGHLKGDILALCVDRVIKIDVEIQYELDALEDDLEDELLLSQYDGQPYSPANDINTEPPIIDDSTESSSNLFLDPTPPLTTLRDTITTLDALMTTLFTYLEEFFPATTDTYPSLEAENLFDSLLDSFVTRILPTYHSRHAQFLIFKTAQSHILFLDRFLGLLIERTLDPSLPNIARQASSAYLASFIARAKNLNRETIRTVVEMLCVFLSRCLDEMPHGKFIPGGVAGNNGLAGLYAVFQAVIYIYCFRWRELCEEEDGETVWLSTLSVVQRMAWSALNPLAHVSQEVAQEFARRSYELQHIFVHSILKENARKGMLDGFLRREVTSTRRDVSSGVSGEMVEIQTVSAESRVKVEEESIPRDWYPFDPYVLPRSKGFVTECFLEYKPSDQEEDDEIVSDDESDESDDMDEDM